MAGAGTGGSDVVYSSDDGGLYTFTIVVSWTCVTSHHSMFDSGGHRLTADQVILQNSDECCHAVMFTGDRPSEEKPW